MSKTDVMENNRQKIEDGGETQKFMTSYVVLVRKHGYRKNT